MKILIVSQYYYPENFVISKVAEKLVSYGHDVTVLTAKPNYGYGYIFPEYKNIKFEEVNGVKINRVNIIPRGKSRFSIIRNYLSFWRNSKRWARKTKEQFDVVYSMSLSPVTILSAGNLYKKLHKVPHVVHCVDLWPESVLATKAVREGSPMYKILFKWSKKLYSKVDKVLIGSPSFDKYFKNVLTLEKEFVFVPQASLIEDTKNIKPVAFNEGFNIVYCGNLGILQEAEKIPEIMSRVNNKNVYFHIIGMGPKKDELIENISKFKVIKNVFYHGPMDSSSAASFINAADAVYLSMNAEGYVGKTLPNKLMMYLAIGKPIIAAISGDAKEFLKKLYEDYEIKIFTTRNKLLTAKWLINNNLDKYLKTYDNSLIIITYFWLFLATILILSLNLYSAISFACNTGCSYSSDNICWT